MILFHRLFFLFVITLGIILDSSEKYLSEATKLLDGEFEFLENWMNFIYLKLFW